jgi:ATP-dependent helicase/nuclease subunit A
MDMCEPELLSTDVVCPGQWVLMTALRRTEAGELFALGGRPKETQLGDPVWKIAVATPQKVEKAAQLPENEVQELPTVVVQTLKEALVFSYGHREATLAPSKQTATQRKGRNLDQEISENAPDPEPKKRQWRKAASKGVGKEMGNVMHMVLQHISFRACTDAASIRNELSRLIQLGYITEEESTWVNAEKIAAFFRTDIGSKLVNGQQVLREFKFSILDDGGNYDPAIAGEKILLQGVVDCALIEPDGITVVDFKTDFVTDETVLERAEFYSTQVRTYADALHRIYQQPIKQALLYFFHLGKFIPISL